MAKQPKKRYTETEMTVKEIEERLDQIEAGIKNSREALKIFSKGKPKGFKLNIQSIGALDRSVKCVKDFPRKIVSAFQA